MAFLAKDDSIIPKHSVMISICYSKVFTIFTMSESMDKLSRHICKFKKSHWNQTSSKCFLTDILDGKLYSGSIFYNQILNFEIGF